MLNEKGTALLIFDRFEKNYSLPKYRPKNKDENAKSSGSRAFFGVSNESWGDAERDSTSNSWFTINGTTSNTISNVTIIDTPEGPIIRRNTQGEKQVNVPISEVGFLDRLRLLFFKKAVQKKTVQLKVEENFTVEDFFKELKVNGQKLKVVEGRIKDFEDILEYVQSTQQAFLKEKVEKEIVIIRAETNLLSLGLKTVIPEETIISFYKKCQERRPLKLDFIENFGRIIPKKLVDLKKKCDELEIFDNYAILHYDPANKGTVLTPEEVKKKKDPILFGLIADSRNLYYLGDWVDEYCDLTLKDLINEFGAEAISKNDISTKLHLEDFMPAAPAKE